MPTAWWNHSIRESVAFDGDGGVCGEEFGVDFGGVGDWEYGEEEEQLSNSQSRFFGGVYCNFFPYSVFRNLPSAHNASSIFVRDISPFAKPLKNST